MRGPGGATMVAASPDVNNAYADLSRRQFCQLAGLSVLRISSKTASKPGEAGYDKPGKHRRSPWRAPDSGLWAWPDRSSPRGGRRWCRQYSRSTSAPAQVLQVMNPHRPNTMAVAAGSRGVST